MSILSIKIHVEKKTTWNHKLQVQQQTFFYYYYYLCVFWVQICMNQKFIINLYYSAVRSKNTKKNSSIFLCIYLTRRRERNTRIEISRLFFFVYFSLVLINETRMVQKSISFKFRTSCSCHMKKKYIGLIRYVSLFWFLIKIARLFFVVFCDQWHEFVS